MNRREWIKRSGYTGLSILLVNNIGAGKSKNEEIIVDGIREATEITKSDFGPDFIWGIASAAYQTEGAWNIDGKSESNWDHFTHNTGKVERGENADDSTDFYHRFEEDIELVKSMNFQVFRFSLSWSRILPNGIGSINQKGLDFYHRVIDKCISVGLEPWITIYHWDMPQVLEAQGGWTSRQMLDWFSEYVDVVTREFGLKVKNWIVMNEQLSYTAGGYLAGVLAPGRKSIGGFLKAVHHSVLCNAIGATIVRRNVEGANIGTTFFTSYIEPVNQEKKNIEAAARVDAAVNRLFIEPSMGMGYPVETLPVLKKISKYFEAGDEQLMIFDFDFIGIQYYFRSIVEKSIIPGIRANEVKASERGVEVNEMGGEIYPEGLYHILKKFSGYKRIRNMLVTENGVCVPDQYENGRIQDNRRIGFFNDHLLAVRMAKEEGINVNGYMVWSPTDNFEWDKGYRTRFGLVYIDYQTKERIMKDSGLWFRNFLK
ncbi:MAG: beta-glucosidase [Prolixibacteraceae bacterium]|nr:beta-glucosidase [Prolixibacteraceae bacterium]